MAINLENLTARAAEALLAEARDQYEDARAAIRNIAPVLNENMAFYTGQQYGIPTYAGVLNPIPTPQAMETYNYIWPTVRSWTAQMLRSRPNLIAIAPSNTSDDIARSMATNRLVRSLVSCGAIPHEHLYRGETKVSVHGAGWWKIYWNPKKGNARKYPRILQTPFGEVPDVDQFGSPRYDEGFDGGPCFEFHDFMDVMPDPNAATREEIRYVMHRKKLPQSTAEDVFKYDAYGKPTRGRFEAMARDVETIERDAVENSLRATNYFGSGSVAQARGNIDVRIIEAWYQPTFEHPGGMVLVWSGDMLLAASRLPYDWPWILRLGPGMRGSLVNDGIVSHLKPLQRTLNLNASKRKEWIDFILSPPLLVPEGSDIRKDHLSDIAGYLLYYNSTAGAPKWMDVPNIPESMFSTEGQLVQMMKDISAISDIDRGGVPQGLSTAKALAYLYEFQQGVTEPDVRLFQEDYRDAIKKILKLHRDFTPEERLIQMIGSNGRQQLVEFKRANYNFDSEIVLENDTQPNSKALQLANAKEDFQLGALEDTPAADRYRRRVGLHYGDPAEVDAEGLNQQRAINEQAAFVQAVNEGTDPAAALFVLQQDRHDVHHAEHLLFRISDTYLALPDWAKQMMDEHDNAHEMLLMETAQMVGVQQQAMGETAAGPPPPKQGQLPGKAGEASVDTDAGPATADAESFARETQQAADTMA